MCFLSFFLLLDPVSFEVYLTQLDFLLMTLCSSPFLSGWLDDIGLPQYKTQFDEGRVDGRMLHYMTVVSVDEAHALPPQTPRISRSDASSAISH